MKLKVDDYVKVIDETDEHFGTVGQIVDIGIYLDDTKLYNVEFELLNRRAEYEARQLEIVQ